MCCVLHARLLAVIRTLARSRQKREHKIALSVQFGAEVGGGARVHVEIAAPFFVPLCFTSFIVLGCVKKICRATVSAMFPTSLSLHPIVSPPSDINVIHNLYQNINFSLAVVSDFSFTNYSPEWRPNLLLLSPFRPLLHRASWALTTSSMKSFKWYVLNLPKRTITTVDISARNSRGLRCCL